MHSPIVDDPVGPAQSSTATVPASPTGGKWQASSKTRQCPICGRTKDGDCRINTDGRVKCRHDKPHAIGEVVSGLDGCQYGFTGNGALGGHFKPHRAVAERILKAVPSGVTAEPVPALLPLPSPSTFFLARFTPDVAAVASRKDGDFYYYDDKHRQQRKRKGLGPEKEIYIHHFANGKWLNGANGTCPSYNENCLPLLDGLPLYIEGEKCAQIVCDSGIVSLSIPGHQAESLQHCTTAFKRHRELGLKAVAYLSDVGEAGRQKENIIADAAAAAGLPAVIINAGTIWQDLPDNGNIDDLAIDADEMLASIDQAFRDKLAEIESSNKIVNIGDKVTKANKDPANPVNDFAEKPKKARFLDPGEVLDKLVATIGSPSLNVRTNGAVIEGEHVGPDQVRRYYLRLSKRTAADGIKWQRGSTADGIVELASQNSFGFNINGL